MLPFSLLSLLCAAYIGATRLTSSCSESLEVWLENPFNWIEV